MKKIIVRVYSDLNLNLEESRKQKWFEVDVPDDIVPSELLKLLGTSGENIALIVVNGEVVSELSLKEGDKVELYPVISGG